MRYSEDDNFNKMAQFTLLREGPMSNDRVDPGGLTKYGIAKSAHPNVDIANLTKEQALEIYYNEYYLASHANEVPFAFGLAIFECAVNQGLGRALMLLQKAIGATADGQFGAKSIAALKASRSSPDVLSLFMAFRVQAYNSIATSNPELFEQDNKGWFKRLFLCAYAGGYR